MHIGLLELASDIKNSTAIMARTIDDQDISFCISKPWDRSYFPVICIEAAPLYPFPVGRCHLHDKGEKFDELFAYFFLQMSLGCCHSLRQAVLLNQRIGVVTSPFLGGPS